MADPATSTRRADIDAGEVFVFTIGQGFLLGITIYILIPSLMLFLSLVLPPRATRTANIVVAILYSVTVVGGAIGEWSYYVLGSAFEVALLAGVAYYAWTWPRATDDATPPSDERQVGTRVHSALNARGVARAYAPAAAVRSGIALQGQERPSAERPRRASPSGPTRPASASPYATLCWYPPWVATTGR